MGRWLDAVCRTEKNTKTPSDGTDKTDITVRGGVLSILSVPHAGTSENFSSKVGTGPRGSVSFGSSVSGAFREESSEPRINRCESCGAIASFGVGCFPTRGIPGRWYCAACLPIRERRE